MIYARFRVNGIVSIPSFIGGTGTWILFIRSTGITGGIVGCTKKLCCQYCSRAHFLTYRVQAAIFQIWDQVWKNSKKFAHCM